MRRIRGPLALGVAAVLCPCHLPLVGAVLAGTALGAGISQGLAVVLPLAVAGFVVALILGLRWISREEPASEACPTCEPATETNVRPLRIDWEVVGRGRERSEARAPVAGRR